MYLPVLLLIDIQIVSYFFKLQRCDLVNSLCTHLNVCGLPGGTLVELELWSIGLSFFYLIHMEIVNP